MSTLYAVKSTILALCIAFVTCANNAHAQQNIVPNGSFEEYSNVPLGWFYKGSHFSRVIKYWHSPTTASPDVFGPKVRVPRQWAEKGFGEGSPRSGTTMVGITMYGCDDGKPHCREYLQIQLSEPLVVGQKYSISAFFAPLKRSMRCNQIGFAFPINAIKEITDKQVELEPMFSTRQVVCENSTAWQKVGAEFIATEASEFLVIGNFSSDENTISKEVSDHFKFGYYYVDDVVLRKLKPLINVPIPEDDLSQISLEEGKIVRLKDIFFDHDKTDLLPRSYVELNKLKTLLNNNPKLTIEIRGHTDNSGDDLYNLSLSKRRAMAVSEYLFQRGIDESRVRYIGFGSEQPISENSSAEGRQMNRRVEFLVLTN